MKKKEAVKQLETIVDAADRVNVDIVVDGKGMDADPIVAGMMAGMMYAAALLEDEDGSVMTDPGKVFRAGVMSTLKILGCVKLEEDE